MKISSRAASPLDWIFAVWDEERVPRPRRLLPHALLLIAAVGCSPSGTSDGAGGGSSSATSGGSGGAGGSNPCPLCVTDQDCANGGVCAQLGSDSYCAPPCDASMQCASGRSCAVVTNVSGDQVSVCVPATGDCAAPPPGAGGGSSTGMCGTLVDPTTKAGCSSCSGASCQANGCYGGWWCDTSNNKCHAPPTNCGTGGGPPTMGPPPTGTVNGSGGTLSHLLFTVVGDTRPAVIDDTAGYPNAIIGKIYSDIQALNPRPPFSLSTGDYVFAKPYGSTANAQFDLYLAARNKYSGVVFPAMGNHECTGGTASNCGPGTTDGVTNNMSAFVSKLLSPIGKSLPYYSVEIDATDASWTSKFVFVAANAWSTAQATWLAQALSKPTTYTFVIRHESQLVTQAPGVSPSEQIIGAHPLTLEIVGHTHTYERYGNEIVVGNGGAPLTGSKNYGYALIYQRPNGTIQVDMIDYATGTADPSFHFAVHPDGTPSP